MIHYSLRCDSGHEFDGWFASSAAFDEQKQAGVLACPMCGSADVGRAMMAPAVHTSPAATGSGESSRETPSEEAEPRAEPATPPGDSKDVPVATPLTVPESEREKFVSAVRALREAVAEHGTDVGSAFPEEARRIHYGEAEPRGIYGKAAPEEAEALLDEGIEILPIPTLPEDRN